MKIVCMKYKNDDFSFKFFQNIGMDTCEVEDLEQTDRKLSELVNNHYHTIIMSNEVASFSEDIIKKYNKNKEVNIIIAPSKQEY